MHEVHNYIEWTLSLTHGITMRSLQLPTWVSLLHPCTFLTPSMRGGVFGEPHSRSVIPDIGQNSNCEKGAIIYVDTYIQKTFMKQLIHKPQQN